MKNILWTILESLAESILYLIIAWIIAPFIIGKAQSLSFCLAMALGNFIVVFGRNYFFPRKQ